MAITRRRAIAIAKIEKATPPPQKNSVNKEKTQIIQQEPSIGEAPPSEYEQIREQRIRENKERLEKLGIADLSLKLIPTKTPSRRKILPKTPSSQPPRRSSRLQNGAPVSSTFICLTFEQRKRRKYGPTKEKKEQEPKKVDKKKGPKKKHRKLQRRKKEVYEVEEQGPEVYSEEHEKLLGNTDKEWTLCVDGYGPNGSRIYDPINGKSCHQCRQKTLGLRTHCRECNLVRGQFCGDCLYMRYGEHIVEANEKPNWICPPCRGICNCSLCRQAKGWPPTGLLYRKIKSLGFKSVAHYLIMTKRAPPNSNKSAQKPQSAKRSLPFEGMQVPSDERSRKELSMEVATENGSKQEELSIGGISESGKIKEEV